MGVVPRVSWSERQHVDRHCSCCDPIERVLYRFFTPKAFTVSYGSSDVAWKFQGLTL